MRHLTPILCIALASSACEALDYRVPERELDSMARLDESPLLIDLPPDRPRQVDHARSLALRIADGRRMELLEFPETPLPDALQQIGALAETTLMVDAGIEGVVDAVFEDVTLDEALAILLEQNDLTLLPGPGRTFFVERLDDPTQVTDFIQLLNVRAADVQENLAALIGSTANVIVDIDSNLVCIVGSYSDVAKARRYLERVDTLRDQVLVEVHVFEVTYEDGFDFGAVASVNDTISSKAVDLLSSFGQSGGFSLVLTDADGDLSTTIDAVRRNMGLELVSSPRVLALTNTQANVDVVREIPYVETTAITSGTTAGVGSTVQQAVQFKEAGLTLQLTPSIQEQGYLRMRIAQTLSDEVGRFNDIPIIDKRSLESEFLVRDRETIVLGGLIQDRHTEERRGVPLLMHIPILGQLFRSDSDVKRKQELLIFVTPRILSPSQAAQLAPHYQDNYAERRRDVEDFPR